MGPWPRQSLHPPQPGTEGMGPLAPNQRAELLKPPRLPPQQCESLGPPKGRNALLENASNGITWDSFMAISPPPNRLSAREETIAGHLERFGSGTPGRRRVLNYSTSSPASIRGGLPQSNPRVEIKVVKKFWAKSLVKTKTVKSLLPTDSITSARPTRNFRNLNQTVCN